MNKFDDYIQRKRRQADLALHVKKNIELTKGMSDDELRVHNTDKSVLHDDKVYKILTFMNSGSNLPYITVKLPNSDITIKFPDSDRGEIDVYSILCAPAQSINGLIAEMENRSMKKSDYERINNPSLRADLREAYRKWYPKLYPGLTTCSLYPKEEKERMLKEMQDELDNVFGTKGLEKKALACA